MFPLNASPPEITENHFMIFIGSFFETSVLSSVKHDLITSFASRKLGMKFSFGLFSCPHDFLADLIDNSTAK